MAKYRIEQGRNHLQFAHLVSKAYLLLQYLQLLLSQSCLISFLNCNILRLNHVFFPIIRSNKVPFLRYHFLHQLSSGCTANIHMEWAWLNSSGFCVRLRANQFLSVDDNQRIYQLKLENRHIYTSELQFEVPIAHMPKSIVGTSKLFPVSYLLVWDLDKGSNPGTLVFLIIG